MKRLDRTRRAGSSRTAAVLTAAVAFFCAATAAHGDDAKAAVRVVDCVRDAALDYWAAGDASFCAAVMSNVFARAGLETENIGFGPDHMIVGAEAEVICSAFRRPETLENYDFPVQPLGRMHFALYATPERAEGMKKIKITDWPRMRVGYSPVSQGQTLDRQDWFHHALLTPEFAEFPTSAGAVEALKAGQIDALFLYTPIGRRPEGLVEVVPIGERNVYFAVRKDRPELLGELSRAYRSLLVDEPEKLDAWREEYLGVGRPEHRVRVAAYRRGGLLEISPDGEISGIIPKWLDTIAEHADWSLDWIFGDFADSVDDVAAGKLDIVAGLIHVPGARPGIAFPHTPTGILRTYLWARPDSKYKPGTPESWRGMRVGALAGSMSGNRAKRQFGDGEAGVSVVDFATNDEMIEAYFSGKVDAIVDVEQPLMAGETALQVYAARPMYVCSTDAKPELLQELETALSEIRSDASKFMALAAEHRYGTHQVKSELSPEELLWADQRSRSGVPVYVDFSPWPFPVVDENGSASGFPKAFLDELTHATGIEFLPQAQTGIQTAEAKFLRGDTEVWIPFPAKTTAAYGAASVATLQISPVAREWLGAGDDDSEAEVFVSPHVPDELASILRKALSEMDANAVQRMMVKAYMERNSSSRVFGLTLEELRRIALVAGSLLALGAIVYGTVMIVLLKRHARRAQIAAALAESHSQAKTRFLAMMSHELRTPLNAVIGFSEFLAKEDVDEAKRREYVDNLLMSANALLGLINDVLDLSKLEAGAMEMRAGSCDVDKLMRELPAIFGYRVRRHNVELRVSAPNPPAPPLKLSQQGLRQILINLVGNSAKFTESGSISVSGRWESGTNTLRIEVHDTGRGISKEKMDKLFDPFVQDIASRIASRPEENTGTGLGLPIVKRMVEAAGGTVRAESEIGKGTSFYIEIPGLETAAPPAPPPNLHAPRAGAAVTSPQKVLVVDDMPMNRKVLGLHLQKLGVTEIRYAENGVKALEQMTDWIPNLVLTDMWMPDMDGSRLAEAMHREERLSEIPVVAVTADVDVDASHDMSLFDKVLAKPVTGDKLLALFGEI